MLTRTSIGKNFPSSTPTRRPSHPALSPATLSRLPSLVHVTGPWVPRSRYPPDSPSLWQPLVSAVSKPLAPDTAPQDGLRREATFFLELLDGGQGDSGWDESAFDRVRNERREFLMGEGRVAGWGPPQVHDVHFGPLTTPTGQINYLGSNYPSVAPRVALITGFPVGPDYIWSKAHHLAGPPNKLAATAQIVNDLFSEYLPGVAEGVMWLDVVSCPRHHLASPDLTTPIELSSFNLTCAMIQQSACEILWITQKDNHQAFVAQLPPTHVVGSELVTSARSSSLDLDDRWKWCVDKSLSNYNTNDGLARPITQHEIEVWAELNLLELSGMLPFSPTAVFVRRWQGGPSRVMLFSPHPCSLNQSTFPSTFYPAVDETERCASAVGALLWRSLAPAGVQARSAWIEARLRDLPSSFQQGLALFKSVDLFRGVSAAGITLLDAVKQLRAGEKTSGVAIPASQLSPKLREYIADKLIPDQPTAALDTFCPKPTSSPPSVLGNLLSFLQSTNLTGLARLERADDLSPSQAAALAQARASPTWRFRLEHGLGMTPDFCESPFRFTYALHREQRLQHESISLTALARTSIGSARSDRARHVWTAHEEEDGKGVGQQKRLVMGRLRSEEVGRPGVLVVGPWRGLFRWYDGAAACTDCEALGLPACYVPYLNAITAGWVSDLVGPEAALEGLSAWITAWGERGESVKQEEYERARGQAKAQAPD